jgi:hypothetical protein
MARRQAGHFGPADLLVIVLIADAAQNGLGKEYQSVTEGLVLVMTIVAWEYFIDWLTYRYSGSKACPQTSVSDPSRRRTDCRRGNAQRNAIDR